MVNHERKCAQKDTMKIYSLIVICFLLFAISAKESKQALMEEFEVGLGKNDPYYGVHFDSFDQIFNTSYTCILSTPVPIKLKEISRLIKKLYVSSKEQALAEQPKKRIPKIIHQIWLGSPLPERYKKWVATWQSLGPDWKYILWTDKEVETFQFPQRKFYDHATNWGAKSDILRMEILKQQGGLYVDIDFECINPQIFDTLVNQYDFFCALHPLDCKDYLLQNALIGVIPNHPIVDGYQKELQHYYYKSGIDVIKATGPGMFTWAFFKHAPKSKKQGYRDIVLPPSVLFPLGFFQASRTLIGLDHEALKQKVLKKDSAAIHWWEGSWH